LDINGANNIKKSNLPANFIAIFPPGLETLEKRLLYRNTEQLDVIKKRLDEAVREVNEMKKSEIFNNSIINDDLENSYKEFKAAIVSMYPNLDKI
jgi:guanylate kinase